MYKTAIILIEYMEKQMTDEKNNSGYQNSLIRCVSALKGLIKYW